MLSSRPYLARALYEWLLDNDNTPYIVVDAEQEGVQVPRQHVQNGQIVLNIAPGAVRDLLIANEGVSFNARFGGQPMHVNVPTAALVALYSRENGVGMVFGHEPVMPGADETTFGDVADAGEPDAATRPKSARPTLASVGGAQVASDPQESEKSHDGAEDSAFEAESSDATDSAQQTGSSESAASDVSGSNESAGDAKNVDGTDDDSDGEGSGQPKPPRKGRPSLRVIK